MRSTSKNESQLPYKWVAKGPLDSFHDSFPSLFYCSKSRHLLRSYSDMEEPVMTKGPPSTSLLYSEVATKDWLLYNLIYILSSLASILCEHKLCLGF